MFFDDLKLLRKHSKAEHGSATEWSCNQCKQVLLVGGGVKQSLSSITNSASGGGV